MLCICRYDQLLTLVHSVNGASLLVGGPGTAKTTVINQFIGKFNSELVVSKTITFSSLTTPQIFQMAIEGAVEKRQGRCGTRLYKDEQQNLPLAVCLPQHTPSLVDCRHAMHADDVLKPKTNLLAATLFRPQDVWPAWWQAHVRVC